MKKTLHFLVTFAGLAIAMPSMALKSDRDQPAEIEADNTEIDFNTGVRTLTDNVLIIQGTLRLKADKLIAVYNTKTGNLSKATAWGSLARFKQRPDDKPDDVEGWGKKMVVDYTKNTLTLIGQAALKQGETIARGETIIYNMDTDKLRIVGKSKINTPGKSGQKKKLDDPFKDDIPNTEPVNSKPKVTATPSGRSRLIIQPKVLKEN